MRFFPFGYNVGLGTAAGSKRQKLPFGVEARVHALQDPNQQIVLTIALLADSKAPRPKPGCFFLLRQRTILVLHREPSGLCLHTEL